jgi:hypothetical protein
MGWAQKITPPRRGTELIDQGNYYLKTSHDRNKIECEYRYYQRLPLALRDYHPPVSKDATTTPGSYLIKKIPTNDASIVLTDATLFTESYFKNLLQHLEEFFSHCPIEIVSKDFYRERLEKEVFKKDRRRLQQLLQLPEALDLARIAQQSGFQGLEAVQSTLHQLLEKFFNALPRYALRFSHGDLCLSNVLIDKNRFYLIDPRGLEENDDGMGIEHYDYAKLSQCFEGGYDFINHGLASKKAVLDVTKKLYLEFCQRQGIDRPFLKTLEASFFLSMIPLHDDSPAKMRSFLRQCLNLIHEILP